MIERSLFEYLVNSLWQLPLLAGAVWMLIRIGRPSLAVQHALWIVTLLFAVALPLRGIDWNTPSSTPEPPLLIPVIAMEASFDHIETVPHKDIPIASGFSDPASLRMLPLHLSDRAIDWLISLYALSVAFSLARLFRGYLAARRLVADAVRRPLTALESALLHVCASRIDLSADRLPEIRFLDDPASSPMVVGVRHPVLLLPAGLRHSAEDNFNDNDLTAILSHELAHVRRRDYFANLAARVISLPVAYHPVIHALHRRIRQTREMICDAEAAGSFDSASTYARSLLAIADRTVKPFTHVEAVGLFDQTRNTLEERIMNLTSERLPVSLSLRAVRIAGGTAILLTAMGTAAILHVKPTASSIFASPTVYAAQAPQSAPGPDPQQAPATATPAPGPAPKAHHTAPTVIVDGEARDLTPEEQQKLEKDLGASMEQLKHLKIQFDDPAFKKQLADSMKVFDSAEFKKQMEELKINLKGLDSPEFRQQIEEAQKLAALSALDSSQFKLQMDQLKLQLDSPEFRAQMEQAKNLALQDRADSDKRSAETRQQLDEARQAIEEVKKQIHDAKIQQQLEQAQRNIENATPKD